MLDKKLQLKDAQTIAVIDGPTRLGLAAQQTDFDNADAVLLFACNKARLSRDLDDLKRAVDSNKLTWIAYPKGKQLNTDLNRDIVRSILNENGLNPVRQISIDDTWSALRIRKLS
jgi:hypothetical protein